MLDRKPQNSILVIATLGVYLGLLMAGATPQILAQAATTRIFDVKDEIEVKEDLDNKPKGDFETSTLDSIPTYLGVLRGYLNDVVEYDFRVKSVYPKQFAHIVAVPCLEVSSGDGLFASESKGYIGLPVLLDSTFTEGVGWGHTVSCRKVDSAEDQQVNFADVYVFGNGRGDYYVEFTLKYPSTSRSQQAFTDFQRYTEKFDSSRLSISDLTLWQNTKVSLARQQIQLTTRLARADIASPKRSVAN